MGLDAHQNAPRTLTTRCCIVGGGPAGMMLGYLLGRAGINTLVLEKHADFLRDFRGDTVHPSTMQIMQELGILDEFLKRPHQKLVKLEAEFGGRRYRMADMSRLDTACPFIAFMPQWEFLDFLAEKSAVFPNLKILRSTGVTDLIETGGRVTGVVARDAQGDLRIAADLTIGCDGRHSTVRERAGLVVETIGAPIDVLWFRVTKGEGAFDDTFLRGAPGRFLITLDRGDYWQCAYVIAKGAMAQVTSQGLPAFRDAVVDMAPTLRRHIGDVVTWDDVKLLTVTIDRLRQWSRPGVLCIGDAAHAMSPVGGVGINLAIQDAVATANMLAEPLRHGCPSQVELDGVRRRRLLAVRVIQAIQTAVQSAIIARSLDGASSAPLPIRLVGSLPWLQGVAARVIGLGIRQEHVRRPQR